VKTGTLVSLFLFLTVFFLGCDNQAPITSEPPPLLRVNGEKAFEEVKQLVELGPRESGTPGGKKAATWLFDRLKSFGISTEMDVFDDDTPNGTQTFRNVIGTLPGTGHRRIILCSHYDTKTGIDGFVGANDSGSSSGLLLEMARLLAEQRKIHNAEVTIQCVFFDGEECRKKYSPNDGLHGSRHMAEKLEASGEKTNVMAVILFDMIGDKNMTITIPRNGTPNLISGAFKAAREEGCREQFYLLGSDLLDDHVPFIQRGMPAVDLIDFWYGPEKGRSEFWHNDKDTLDKLSPESLEKVGNVVFRMIQRLANENK